MSNKFGKLLRKYRNDSKLRLLDVAQKMSWSVVYLVEVGIIYYQKQPKKLFKF